MIIKKMLSKKQKKNKEIVMTCERVNILEISPIENSFETIIHSASSFNLTTKNTHSENVKARSCCITLIPDVSIHQKEL